MQAIKQWLKDQKNVEFDCEAENGFGWYWFIEGTDTTDNKGYMTEDEAVEAACAYLGVTHFVIRANPEVWGIHIHVGGAYELCLNYMDGRAYKGVDLMYPNGRLSSWVARR